MRLKRFISRRNKKKEEETSNPFKGKGNAKPTKAASGNVFQGPRFYSLEKLGGRKIRIRFLRQLNRTIAGGLCILYVIMGIASITSPFCLLFFATAYFLLKYLWQSKRSQWRKQDEA